MSKVYQNRNGVLTLVQDDSNFATKSEVANCVDKSTNQTVGGVKTFSSLPKVPTTAPTADAEVVSRKTLNDALSAQETTIKSYVDTADTNGNTAYSLVVRTDTGADVAATHNGIYRGANLVSVFGSANAQACLTAMSTALNSGDFSKLFIGDYIDLPVTYSNNDDNGQTGSSLVNLNINLNATSIRFRIAHLNYWMNKGVVDSNNAVPNKNTFGETTKNHILFIPDKGLFTCWMNPTNTTSVYNHPSLPETGHSSTKGSYLWRELNGIASDGTNWKPGLATRSVYKSLNAATCFNGHILGHSTYLGCTMNPDTPSMAGMGWNGATTGAQWTDEYIGLCTEVMAYGSVAFSSSGRDVSCGDSQLALFRLDPSWLTSRHDRTYWWLSAVSSSVGFADANTGGFATCTSASYRRWVRPFLLFS